MLSSNPTDLFGPGLLSAHLPYRLGSSLAQCWSGGEQFQRQDSDERHVCARGLSKKAEKARSPQLRHN